MTAPAAEGAKGPRLRTWQDFASAEVGFRACGHDQRTEPVWRLCDRPLETFARSLLQLCRGQRWQVAAALSAAVTTTMQQENAPNLHGREPPKEESSLFPATLRERGSGGEALLLEKRPLPQRSPYPCLLGREREGGGFSSEKPPPSQNPCYSFYFICVRMT